jgi:ABC-2 type transport system ATP-binding protein
MQAMVELDRLSKQFGPVTAVRDVSFSLQRGEVLGFLGPNGAGKTTTMRMLTGFLAPSAGHARIMGHDVEREPIAARALIGYLPEGAPLYGDMSPLALLRFIAEARGLADRGSRIDQAIARTQLEEVAHRPIETLSKGFKRRVGLAAAILHDPPVLILDEPTDGLDPNQKHEVRALIAEMAADKAIIVSTHILEEVPAICTRAIVIAHGRIVADATPDELAACSRYENAVRVRLGPDSAAALEAALRKRPEVREVSATPNGADAVDLLVIPHDARPIDALVRDAITTAGLTVEELRVERGRLDDVFRALTTGGAG